LVMISSASHAEIYKCTKDDGSTEFSDEPCSRDAEKIDVNPTSQGGGNLSGGYSDEFIEERATRRKVESLNDRIEDLYEERKEVQSAMDAELVEYRSQRQRANNNLAGAVWENSLAKDADVIRERYQSEIDQINRDIERLKDRKNEIRNRD